METVVETFVAQLLAPGYILPSVTSDSSSNANVNAGPGGVEVWVEGKEKMRKIIEIWRKNETFASAVMDRLENLLKDLDRIQATRLVPGLAGLVGVGAGVGSGVQEGKGGLGSSGDYLFSFFLLRGFLSLPFVSRASLSKRHSYLERKSPIRKYFWCFGGVSPSGVFHGSVRKPETHYHKIDLDNRHQPKSQYTWQLYSDRGGKWCATATLPSLYPSIDDALAMKHTLFVRRQTSKACRHSQTNIKRKDNQTEKRRRRARAGPLIKSEDSLRPSRSTVAQCYRFRQG